MAEPHISVIEAGADALVGVSPRPHPGRTQLARYPYRFPSRIRFSDLDLLAHVNNLALESFHEDARASLNQEVFAAAGPLDGPRFMAVQNTTHFLAQAFWPGELTVGAGVGRIGRTSYVACTGVFHGSACVSLCDTVLVLVADSTPQPLGDAVRAALTGYLLGTGGLPDA